MLDSSGASEGSLLYSITRSTDVIWFSTSADCRTPHWNIPVKAMAEDMANPASLPLMPIRKKRDMNDKGFKNP